MFIQRILDICGMVTGYVAGVVVVMVIGLMNPGVIEMIGKVNTNCMACANQCIKCVEIQEMCIAESGKGMHGLFTHFNQVNTTAKNYTVAMSSLNITTNETLAEICYSGHKDRTTRCLYNCTRVPAPLLAQLNARLQSKTDTDPVCAHFRSSPGNKTVNQECFIDHEAKVIKLHCKK